MKFGDDDYLFEVIVAKGQLQFNKAQSLLLAHERVLTLEAEIKVLVDGAGKDRAEIERLEGENQTLRAGFSASDEFGHGMVLKYKSLEEEVKIARERLGPAGYRILQEVKELRTTIEEYRKRYGKLNHVEQGESE